MQSCIWTKVPLKYFYRRSVPKRHSSAFARLELATLNAVEVHRYMEDSVLDPRITQAKRYFFIYYREKEVHVRNIKFHAYFFFFIKGHVRRYNQSYSSLLGRSSVCIARKCHFHTCSTVLILGRVTYSISILDSDVLNRDT